MEVDRDMRVVTTCVLVGIHNASPHYPVRVVLEEVGIKNQWRAQRVVADVVEAVVQGRGATPVAPRVPSSMESRHPSFVSSLL